MRVSMCSERSDKKDMLNESFSSPCCDFEGHMQKHRKGGRVEGFTGIYLD